MSEITTTLLWHIAYDLFKFFLEFLIALAPVALVLKKMTDFLNTWWKTIAVWGATSLTLSLGLIVISSSTRPSADFKTGISVGYGGVETGLNPATGEEVPNPDKAGKVIILATLINSGAPSIARGFALTADINGRTYNGEPITMGNELTMRPAGQDQSVKFSASNALYNRALTPIPTARRG